VSQVPTGKTMTVVSYLLQTVIGGMSSYETSTDLQVLSTQSARMSTLDRPLICPRIDAPSADAEEFHNQTTHIWYSGPVGPGLELLFDFGTQYDFSTLHFWNYTGESYDVDNIDFTFFDASNSQVGALSIVPALGSTPGIRAQDIVLAAPLNVQFVTAFLSGTNGQIDFQNIGFTANLSTDRCTIDPNDPICNPSATSVPEPSSILLVAFGLLGFRFAQKQA
jgi:hypothetical protein